MPASSPPPGSSPPAEENRELSDAPAQNDEEQFEAASTATREVDTFTNGHATVGVKLEDIFDRDDDDDDEFPNSSANHPVSSSPPAGPASSEITSSITFGHSASFTDPQIMTQFYSRLFPFRPLFLWLNHSPKPSTDFGHREFALTLPNDAYLRYQSYATSDMLRKDILRLIPSRFEIGPVYTANPRDRKTLRKATAFRPLSKEIVFDIDLTDYDDIRTCCSAANICDKCWTFATMAIKVIDVALRDDFGFEHILWVYSGRRGVHAWISDKSARELDDDKRRAVTGYFEVLKGGAQGGKKVNIKRPLHPHITRSLEILKPYFQTSILEEQDPFASQAGWERLLQLLPDKTLNDALRKKWSSSPERASAKKWADIDSLAATGVSKTLDTRSLMEAKQDILLEYTYPRLDVEVGKKRIHLLKSPFVVHPGTGRVCVPICTSDVGSREGRALVDGFDPLSVPTVTELLSEVDSWVDENDVVEKMADELSTKRVQDFEKTRLKPYVEMFERFCRSMMKSEQSLKRERDDDGMEF